MKKLLFVIILGISVCSASQHAEFGVLERDDVMPAKTFYSLWNKSFPKQFRNQDYMISLDDYKPFDYPRIVVHPSSWVQITAGMLDEYRMSADDLEVFKGFENSDAIIEAKWNAEKRSWRLEFPLPKTDTCLYLNIRKVVK